MKENITNLMSRITKWLTLVVAVTLVSQSARAVIVYDNLTTRETNNVGDPLFFGQSGYEFGDEVVLSPAANAYLTNFTLEYYGTNLSGATMTFRVYANNGDPYGTNFSAPGDLLFDSGAFALSDGISNGFGTLTFNQANSGFAIPVPSNFTWTVQFAGVGAGTAGLALYDPPTVGTDYAQYWEQTNSSSAWEYRNGTPGSGLTNINFGAVADSETLAVDTTLPSIAIKTPVNKLRTNAPAIEVTGIAKDAGGVALVLYKLNSGSYRPATLSTVVAGTTNWAAQVELAVGANTFLAKAIDRAGNVKVAAATSYTFVVTNTFTVTFAEGASSGYTKGILNMTNAVTATTNLEIGQTYALQIIPTKINGVNTFWYSNTIATSSEPTETILGTSAGAKFVFTMKTNLSFLVNCVTNRFIAAAGIYNGLIGADQTNQSASGFVTIKTDAKNKFSGKISVAGETLPITGLFDLTGEANTIVPKKVIAGSSKQVISKKQILTNSVRLTLNFDGTIGGTLSNDITGVVSDLLANKAAWATNNPATNYSGLYTMVIPPVLNNPDGPSGYSSASVIIDTNGIVKMKGYTADGQAIKQKVVLSQDGSWPFFTANSKDGNANKNLKGSVVGWLGVAPNDGPAISGRVDGSLIWIRTAFPTNIYYPDGFTNISSPVANKYVCNKDINKKWTNSVAGFDGISSGTLTLAAGGLGSSLVMTVSAYTNAIMKADVITGTKPPYETKIAVTPAYGNVSGQFLNPDNGNAKTKFIGIALQDGVADGGGVGHVYGFFNGPAQSGLFKITAP